MSILKSKLIEIVVQALEEMRVPKAAPILVGVSGGVDSMVLLDLLVQIGYKVQVAHVNYNLRGDASKLDAQLIVDYCRQKELKLHQLENEEGKPTSGIQEWAREIRYSFFEQKRIENKLHAIAVGHHLGDQAEQMIWKFIRGGKLHDLTGIKAKSGKIIRPLLEVRKADIYSYAKEFDIPFREDSTNSTSDYARNAIRNEVLPLLENISPGVFGNLQKVRENLQFSEFFHENNKQTFVQKITHSTGAGILLSEKAIKKYPKAVVHSAVAEFLSTYSFTYSQVKLILELSERGTFIANQEWRVIKVEKGWLITDNQPDKFQPFSVPLAKGKYEIGNGRFLEILTEEDPDYDNSEVFVQTKGLTSELYLRRKADGDYLYGANRKKRKLKKLINDKKLELNEREQLIIIQSADYIIWVPGLLQDERFKGEPRGSGVVGMRIGEK